MVKENAEMEKINELIIDPAEESGNHPAAPGVLWYQQNINLEDAKMFIKTNIASAARSFIAVGFYLKCVRDKELYIEDGYESIWDFAKEEYGLSKSTASRYMSMNDKFSVEGNSPIVQEEYRLFDKSKLQEMLYLEDEQLKEVTPDFTVKDIRGLRPPKEITYFPLPGQMEFETDFPEIFPGMSPTLAAEDTGSIEQKQTFAMDISDFLPDDESVATSQLKDEERVACAKEQVPTVPEESEWVNPEEEPVDESYSFAGVKRASDRWNLALARKFVRDRFQQLISGCTVIPDNDKIIEQFKRYSRLNSDKIAVDAGVEAYATFETVEYYQGDEDLGICLYERFANIVRKQMDEYTQEQAAAEKKTWNTTPSPCPHNPEYCSCTLSDVEKGVVGDGTNCSGACCWECSSHGSCKNECNSSANREQNQETVPENEPETVIDADFVEIQTEPAVSYDERTLNGMIEQEHELLNTMGDYWMANLPPVYTQHVMTLQALRDLKEKHREAEPEVIEDEQPDEPDSVVQPELPVLKNNDQRAAFVDNYETWPLWIETKETGERYYRYDLPDGTSMVVKVYHAMLFDYKAIGVPYENRHKEGYGRHEYYLLKDGKFFRDCDANRSLLIEKLKDIQKKGKG